MEIYFVNDKPSEEWGRGWRVIEKPGDRFFNGLGVAFLGINGKTMPPDLISQIEEARKKGARLSYNGLTAEDAKIIKGFFTSGLSLVIRKFLG